MKVKGEYMGKQDEMLLEVVQKEQNKRLFTKQKEGPFKNGKALKNSKAMEIILPRSIIA